MADDPIDTGDTVDTTPPPAPPDTPSPPEPSQDGHSEALEALRAEMASLTAERDALAAQATQTTQELEAKLGAAESARLDAHRRALLAELRGEVVDQLVAGNTVEELEASVALAKAAYHRVADAVRAQVLAERPTLPIVPAGASPRAAPDAESLSPIQKLTMALGRNGT